MFVKGDCPMQRLQVAILVGLLLAGPSLAQPPGDNAAAPQQSAPTQPPGDDFQPPQPTPMEQPAVPESTSAVSDGAPIVDLDPSMPMGNDWRFWFKADYAVAWLQTRLLPPLVTSSPPGTSQKQAGVLALPTTTTVIGFSPIYDSGRSMGRTEFGYWFNDAHTFGVDLGFFVVESKGSSFSANSDGSTILARPFLDTATQSPSSVLVAFPGVSSGSVNIFAATQTFWGTNFDLRQNVFTLPWLHMDSLFGYRYLHYGESLDMQQTVNSLNAVFVPGTKIVSTDSFTTTNNFNGFEFGFQTGATIDRFSIDVLTKLAVGDLRRSITIGGSTTTSVPGGTTTSSEGGVYALQSNIGTLANRAWVLAPEIGVDFSYQLNNNVKLHLGYSLLILDGIARAADQIDFNVNSNLFPPAVAGGVNLPAQIFQRSDIWVQAITMGVEIRY
jgi:hypothetical protein